MGEWLNVAFVATDDLAGVEAELERAVGERGRARHTPMRRRPVAQDPMQYGRGDEVERWGFAGFRVAPGWIALRAAPFELMIDGATPLLATLAARLAVPAFQYNMYDGDSDWLVEVAPDGAIARSGFPASGPRWHAADVDAATDADIDARFRLVDLEPALAAARAAAPTAAITGVVPRVLGHADHLVPPAQRDDAQQLRATLAEAMLARRAALLAWIARVGGTVTPTPHRPGAALPAGDWELWRAHPADIVRATLARAPEAAPIAVGVDAGARALVAVLGGARAEHCDNTLLVETLVPHARLPIRGFTLYADRAPT